MTQNYRTYNINKNGWKIHKHLTRKQIIEYRTKGCPLEKRI